jgi:hypothetical protein
MKKVFPADRIALVQGIVFLVSGVWPVIHMRSFEAVAGRKTDKWLVRTVGILVAVVGGALLRARTTRRITPEIALTAAGSAAGLAAIDFRYGLPGRIPRRYLLDGLMEAGFAILWLPHLMHGEPNGSDAQQETTYTEHAPVAASE